MFFLLILDIWMVGQECVLHLHVFLCHSKVHLDLTHVEVDVDVHLKPEFFFEKNLKKIVTLCRRKKTMMTRMTKMAPGCRSEMTSRKSFPSFQMICIKLFSMFASIFLFAVPGLILFLPVLAVFLPTVRSVFVANIFPRLP